MSSRVSPRVLLVEGKDEVLVLSELLEAAGIKWPRGNEPVNIKQLGGVDEVLATGLLEAELKASGLEALGVIVDADGDPEGRWQRVQQRLSSIVNGFPSELTAGGVIHVAEELRVGAWLMPDNVSSGMLETMLLSLRAIESELAAHVSESVTRARELGAPWRDAHRDKAELHTWLAWQDPPGMQMHGGVRAGVLTPPAADGGFVGWFSTLFQITPEAVT